VQRALLGAVERVVSSSSRSPTRTRSRLELMARGRLDPGGIVTHEFGWPARSRCASGQRTDALRLRQTPPE
jgi:hypothetical protein